MGLTLTGDVLARYQSAIEVLLSPLEFADAAGWASAAHRQVNALFHSDRGMIAFPDRNGVAVHSENLRPQTLAVFRTLYADLQPGAIRIRARPGLDTALKRRRTAGLEVWSNLLIEKTSGVPMKDLPFYHQVMVPGGVVHGAGIAIPLARGEAYLNVAHSRPADDPFGHDAGLELLRLLLPAFKAGIGMLVHLQRARDVWFRTVDELELSVLVCDTDGREVHRNRALREVLAGDPDRMRLVAEMLEMASALAHLRRPRSNSAPEPLDGVGCREVGTPRNRYQVRATYLERDAQGAPAILVSAEKLRPELPSPESLVQRTGLTRREADIALWLARGASNRQIAERLSISPHTVRTHAEHIFAKLGIRSRKALALTLLGYGHLPERNGRE